MKSEFPKRQDPQNLLSRLQHNFHPDASLGSQEAQMNSALAEVVGSVIKTFEVVPDVNSLIRMVANPDSPQARQLRAEVGSVEKKFVDWDTQATIEMRRRKPLIDAQLTAQLWGTQQDFQNAYVSEDHAAPKTANLKTAQLEKMVVQPVVSRKARFQNARKFLAQVIRVRQDVGGAVARFASESLTDPIKGGLALIADLNPGGKAARWAEARIDGLRTLDETAALVGRSGLPEAMGLVSGTAVACKPSSSDVLQAFTATPPAIVESEQSGANVIATVPAAPETPQAPEAVASATPVVAAGETAEPGYSYPTRFINGEMITGPEVLDRIALPETDERLVFDAELASMGTDAPTTDRTLGLNTTNPNKPSWTYLPGNEQRLYVAVVREGGAEKIDPSLHDWRVGNVPGVEMVRWQEVTPPPGSDRLKLVANGSTTVIAAYSGDRLIYWFSTEKGNWLPNDSNLPQGAEGYTFDNQRNTWVASIGAHIYEYRNGEWIEWVPPTPTPEPVIGQVSVFEGKLMVQTETGLVEARYEDVIDTEAGVFRYLDAATGNLIEVPLNPIIEGTMVRAFEENLQSPDSSGFVIQEEVVRQAYLSLRPAIDRRTKINEKGKPYNYDIYLLQGPGTYHKGLGDIILDHSNAYLEGDLERDVAEHGLVLDGVRIITATYEQYTNNENGVADFIEAVVANGGTHAFSEEHHLVLGFGITPDRRITIVIYSKNLLPQNALQIAKEYTLRAHSLDAGRSQQNANIANSLLMAYIAMLDGGVYGQDATPIGPWSPQSFKAFHVEEMKYIPHDNNDARLSGLPVNPQVFIPKSPEQ